MFMWPKQVPGPKRLRVGVLVHPLRRAALEPLGPPPFAIETLAEPTRTDELLEWMRGEATEAWEPDESAGPDDEDAALSAQGAGAPKRSRKSVSTISYSSAAMKSSSLMPFCS